MKDGRFESAKEMMQALIDGLEITCDSWAIGTYAYLSDNEIRNQYGNAIDLSFCHYGDFYIYESFSDKHKRLISENEKLTQENQALKDELAAIKSKWVRVGDSIEVTIG